MVRKRKERAKERCIDREKKKVDEGTSRDINKNVIIRYSSFFSFSAHINTITMPLALVLHENKKLVVEEVDVSHNVFY